MTSATPGGSRARARRAPLCPRARVRVVKSRQKYPHRAFLGLCCALPTLTALDTLTCTTSETQSRRSVRLVPALSSLSLFLRAQRLERLDGHEPRVRLERLRGVRGGTHRRRARGVPLELRSASKKNGADGKRSAAFFYFFSESSSRLPRGLVSFVSDSVNRGAIEASAKATRSGCSSPAAWCGIGTNAREVSTRHKRFRTLY